MKKVLAGGKYGQLGKEFGDLILSNKQIAKPMDIDTIKMKINLKSYESSTEFLSDIKLIHHCAVIAFCKCISELD